MKKKSNKKIINNNNFNNQIWIVFLVSIFIYLSFGFFSTKPITIDYNRFQKMIKSHDVAKIVVIKNQEIVEISLKEEALLNTTYKDELESSSLVNNTFGPHYRLEVSSIESFEKRYDDLISSLGKGNTTEIEYLTESRTDIYSFLQTWGFTILILVGFWFLLRRMSTGGGPGGQIFNISKSKASLFDKESKIKLTFRDVAGLEEAKEEVKEIVEFLKNPKKFTKLGGKIPKGALLVGSPGTGKTLLAKAVAGEANVPFYSLSGSDFVEMFVGRGAARVRKTFARAAKSAPCIIFIDELDALGKSRSGDGFGMSMRSNDEAEQTLNQLLACMDGLDSSKGVCVLAATNRRDVLDQALIRPGRFDRIIKVELPDVQGRERILRVHAKKLPGFQEGQGVDERRVGSLGKGRVVDLSAIASITSGLSGAELEFIVNEAAIRAVRRVSAKLREDGVDLTTVTPAVEASDFEGSLKSFYETRKSNSGVNMNDMIRNVMKPKIV